MMNKPFAPAQPALPQPPAIPQPALPNPVGLSQIDDDPPHPAMSLSPAPDMSGYYNAIAEQRKRQLQGLHAAFFGANPGSLPFWNRPQPEIEPVAPAPPIWKAVQ